MAGSDKDQYEFATGNLHDFGIKAETLVRDLIAAHGLSVHHVGHRVKSRESALRKAEGRTASPSVSSLTDLLGLRVITYFPDQVDVISSLIEREFEIDFDHSVDKRAALDPDRFGYLSAHYVVSVGQSRMRLLEWTAFAGVKFEIQIRSILQHSWAEIEHDLGYKAASSIPTEVRRRFSRLAGLLEIADAEFASIRDELTRYGVHATQTIAAGRDVEINRDSIRALVTEDSVIIGIDELIARLLGVHLTPIEDYYATDRSEDFLTLGLESVKDILSAIDLDADWIARFAAAWIVDDNERTYETMPRGIGLVYVYRHLLLTRASENQIIAEYYAEDSGITSTSEIRRIHFASK